MAKVMLVGKLCADAESFDVETRNGKSQYVSFSVTDYGKPNKRNDKVDHITMEVHFSKEVALKLLPSLVKGKEVVVDGNLIQKDYVTRAGVPKTKLYVSADTVLLMGKNPNECIEKESLCV